MSACTAFVICWAALLAVADDPPASEPRETAPPAAAKSVAILCPVSGKPIDRKVVVRFRDRWVYCATPADLEKFKADPLEYAEGVTTQWEADPILRLQVRCPVTGDPPASTIYVGLGDDAVFFATEDAKKRWEADSKPFQAKLAECFTFQTVCPVSEMAVSPTAKREADGKAVYFRCPHCAGEFDNAPATKRAELVRKAAATAAENEKRWRERHPPEEQSERPATPPERPLGGPDPGKVR